MLVRDAKLCVRNRIPLVGQMERGDLIGQEGLPLGGQPSKTRRLLAAHTQLLHIPPPFIYPILIIFRGWYILAYIPFYHYFVMIIVDMTQG